MRYLKESHIYISLKMKYRDKLEQEFPALGKKNLEDDGFSHMTEDLEDKDNELEENFVENSLTVNPDDFEYDEDTDLLKPKDQVAFDELLEKHPSVNKLKRDDKREQKIANLKKKVLNTLKVSVRKNRDLSCESIKSGCSGWGSGSSSDRDRSTNSRGDVRPRSDDEENASSLPKKSLRRSRSHLHPPKIIISK